MRKKKTIKIPTSVPKIDFAPHDNEEDKLVFGSIRKTSVQTSASVVFFNMHEEQHMLPNLFFFFTARGLAQWKFTPKELFLDKNNKSMEYFLFYVQL